MSTSKKNFPTIGIVLPVYNRESTLSRAIQSVIDQSYTNWKLMIIDDCSTDNSLKIAKEFSQKDKRIQVLRNPKNSGSNYSRNKAIKSLDTKWVAFLDSDDAWRSDHLSNLISRIEYFQFQIKSFKPSIAYAGLVTHQSDEAGRIFPAKLFGDVQKILAQKSFIRTSSMMIHQRVFQTVGLFNEGINGADEYDLLIRAVQKDFKVANSPKVSVDVFLLSDRRHRKGHDFFEIYKLHKTFFKNNLSSQLLGERISWTTNFLREDGSRFRAAYWYMIAFYHAKDFKMLRRSLSAPVYPEISKLKTSKSDQT